MKRKLRNRLMRKKEIEKSTNEKLSYKIDELAEIITLKVMRVGTDKINFSILEMLPSDINTMMKEFNLTKAPVNMRVNELEKVWLVRRSKGTGNVVLTDFGKFFLDKIETGKEMVRPMILDIVNKHMEKI